MIFKRKHTEETLTKRVLGICSDAWNGGHEDMAIELSRALQVLATKRYAARQVDRLWDGDEVKIADRVRL